MQQLSDLRVKLDQMTGRITSKLKDRSRLPLNRTVYAPDGVPIKGYEGVSFLEYALNGLEVYHASLGRYKYPDQFPLLIDGDTATVERLVPKSNISTVRINFKDDMIKFYTQFLYDVCPDKRDDPSTFGETVYCDADLIELTHERINLGRYVAESKLNSDPSIRDVVADKKLLIARLRDPAREEMVLARTREVATRYELPPEVAAKFMGWVIDETVEVEVGYLQKKLAGQGA